MIADGLSPEKIGAARVQPSGPPVVLYVGRLIARKGPTLAVEAFAEFRRAVPARLVIAGDGPLRQEAESVSKRLGIAKDVEFLGNVPFREVGKLYDEASVLLFPSLRESFGSPVLEALGRGLPVVALDRSGIADVATGTGIEKVSLPTRPDDLPARLASALRTVLGDGKWQSRSIDGIDFASTWTWPVKATAATALYQEVVRSRD
jgi:glycosyltransferase involved in cell wall biosynthesis